jgi:MFS transporter, ACS family, hexuronate transporter
MPVLLPDLRRRSRSPAWTWWICVLLLLATTVNYLDRLTLNTLAKPILDDFQLNKRDYGYLESAFGSAFAMGAILSGWLADRINVRWLYALAVLAWSAAGFLTGFAQGFAALLICRILLGLAESANWPCALRTTQHLLPPQDRAMGNSILQSGAAVGAVLTPFVVLPLLRLTGTWRAGFMVIGLAGSIWVLFWLGSVRSADLALASRPPGQSLIPVLFPLSCLFALDLMVHVVASEPRPWLGEVGTWLTANPWLPLAVKVGVTLLGILVVFCWLWWATADDTQLARGLFFRRFWALATVVVMINLTWHYLRAWLPLFLQEQHGYTVEQAGWFTVPYYVSTDVGALTAGFAALTLSRRGWPTHRSRLTVYSICAVLTTLTLVVAVLPRGPLLLGLLLIIGFGALGVFPLYYSFSQELTTRHQGKLTGALGCICWLAMALLQEVVGDVVQRTGSYTLSIGMAGLAPLIGLAVLLLLWGPATARQPIAPVLPDEPSDTWRLAPAVGDGVKTAGSVTASP